MNESVDYITYYYLEDYLFNDVRKSFERNGYLSAFDFFCIIIWKANRAKSKIAKRLLGGTNKTLDEVVKDLTTAIKKQENDKDRMSVLINYWKFRLPTASAILAVLYPDNFSVYDIRICNIIKDFHKVQNKNFESLWDGYQDFLKAVKKEATAKKDLRDKDRWLWGQSFHDQLQKDIRNSFIKENDAELNGLESNLSS